MPRSARSMVEIHCLKKFKRIFSTSSPITIGFCLQNSNSKWEIAARRLGQESLTWTRSNHDMFDGTNICLCLRAYRGSNAFVVVAYHSKGHRLARSWPTHYVWFKILCTDGFWNFTTSAMTSSASSSRMISWANPTFITDKRIVSW